MNRKALLAMIMFALMAPFSSTAHEVVLENFDTSNYVTNNPDGNFTTVTFPKAATPGGWDWLYVGYGTPASGSRETTNVVSGAAWRFDIPQGANLIDPEGSANLNNQGPILMTVLNDSNYEPRSLDGIIDYLGEPPVDWLSPVTFKVSVAASRLAGWSDFKQGINLFFYTGTINSVNHYQHPVDQGLNVFSEASIEVIGKDADGRIALGVFGAFSYTSNAGSQSPAAAMIFENLRIDYTPYQPAISLKKTVGTKPGVCSSKDKIIVRPGTTTVYYCYEVKNIGANPLEYHSLFDDKLGELLAQPNLSLSPGQSHQVIVAADISETTENKATWTAYQYIDTPADNVTATASALVEVIGIESVPTITEWGLVLLSVMLIGSATLVIRRRQKL